MKSSDIVPISLSRRELYDLVWAMPIPEAAARLGISRTWLSKVCQKADVPYPSRIYWALTACGRAPPRTPLPQAGDGDDVIVLRPRPRPPGIGGVVDRPGAEDAFDSRDQGRFHPVLTCWRVEIWRARERSRREPWLKQPTATVELDKRRLLLLDGLLKGVERKGCRIQACACPAGPLCLKIDGHMIDILLRQDEAEGGPAHAGATAEDALASLAPWRLSAPAATPALSIEIRVAGLAAPGMTWSDHAGGALEEQLFDMVDGLSRRVGEESAKAGRLASLAGGAGGFDHRVAEPRRWLALNQIAAEWDGLDRVRRLIDHLKGRAYAGGGALTPDQAKWLEWADDSIARSGHAVVDLDSLIAATEALANSYPDPWPAPLVIADSPRARPRSIRSNGRG